MIGGRAQQVSHNQNDSVAARFEVVTWIYIDIDRMYLIRYQHLWKHFNFYLRADHSVHIESPPESNSVRAVFTVHITISDCLFLYVANAVCTRAIISIFYLLLPLHFTSYRSESESIW